MVNYDLKNLSVKEKLNLLGKSTINCIPYDESTTKVCLFPLHLYVKSECYREWLVSWIQFVPLIADQVILEEADYIIFSHPYARCEDLSHACLESVKIIDQYRKKGAKIVICGKAANLKDKLLEIGMNDLIFYPSNYAKKVGELLNVDIQDEHIVYDKDIAQLNVWPVDGCLQKCGFCRRCYMNIPFESKSLDFLKDKLDWFQKNHPEQMNLISLRAENLTEYGLDLYNEQRLGDVIRLIDSYPEVGHINFDIGISIGEITDDILSAMTSSKKIDIVYMNIEAGTNRLLKVINKKHTIERAKEVAFALREANPKIQLHTTVMYGLPTETLDDIYALADVLTDIYFDSVFINQYINNEGQSLAKLPQLPSKLVRYHLVRLMYLLGSEVYGDSIINQAINNSNTLHPSIHYYYPAGYTYDKEICEQYHKKQSELDERNKKYPHFFPSVLKHESNFAYYEEKLKRENSSNNQKVKRQ